MLVLVLSEAVLVIETDAKNCVHEFEHEHRRKRLSTSTSTTSIHNCAPLFREQPEGVRGAAEGVRHLFGGLEKEKGQLPISPLSCSFV